MNVKKALESKLGTLSDKAVEFAIDQFEKNAKNVGQADKKMDTADALYELSISIDFYNRRVSRVAL